jgi:predicted phage terminase large subunit-like protein
MRTPADIAIYGGAAGGGKTWALLMEPLRHIQNSKFGAVIFRRTFPQIMMEGGMWDDASRLYPLAGAIPNQGHFYWRFPSGARVRFAYLQSEKDKYNYQGAQIPLIGWDQLEQFSAASFFYMLSRNRSTSGVRPYVRATCNPDPDSWLATFIGWWIAEDGYADLSRTGVLRWFVRSGHDILWFDSREEAETARPDQIPRSVTFIPASVYDNKILLREDPDYLANLMAQLPVDRARLLGDPERGGNWKVRAESGGIFDRGWFEIVPAIPPGGQACLFWDFAATAKKGTGDDPDYTAAVLIVEVEGAYYVAYVNQFRAGPAEVDRRFKNISWQLSEAAFAQGRRFRVRWEREPGSAGKRMDLEMVKMLRGLDAAGVPSTGDKLVRAKPLASMAQVGNVRVLSAAWTELFLDHLHNQPASKDDIMDAASGAYNELSGDLLEKRVSGRMPIVGASMAPHESALDRSPTGRATKRTPRGFG